MLLERVGELEIIVNYDDLQCPFCSRMHTTLMTEILPQYGDRIKIVYKDYPLSMHPWAKHSANDANCLAESNSAAYWEFADFVHANQKAIGSGQDLTRSTLELDRIAVDIGKKNGVDTTKLQACLKNQPDKVLKASMAEGELLGLNATPTMYINGQKLEGAVDADEVREAADPQVDMRLHLSRGRLHEGRGKRDQQGLEARGVGEARRAQIGPLVPQRRSVVRGSRPRGALGKLLRLRHARHERPPLAMQPVPQEIGPAQTISR